MKNSLLLILMTSIISFSVNAYDEIQLENNGGEVRFGGVFASGTHVSFYEYLTIQLAKRDVQVQEREGDVTLSYKFKFDNTTVYNIFPKAKMKISLKVGSLTTSHSFSCAPEINDGGNLTIRKKCAAKTARKMKQLLKDLDVQF
jgi:hypothetical protein